MFVCRQENVDRLIEGLDDLFTKQREQEDKGTLLVVCVPVCMLGCLFVFWKDIHVAATRPAPVLFSKGLIGVRPSSSVFFRRLCAPNLL